MTIATFQEIEPVHLILALPAGAITITGREIERNWDALSHFPERRARMELGALAARLNRFEDFAQALAASDGRAGDFNAAAEIERFATRHLSLTRAFWGREGRAMSAFIVGPARFPTARNRKRMNSSDKARDAISYHEQAARKSAERRAFPYGRPDGPIRSDAPDALERLREAHAEAKGPEKRRLADRIADMERLPAETRERIEQGVRIIEDIEDMRLRLIFPGKPDEATRAMLKSQGFRWSPRAGAWQRLLNGHAYGACRRVLIALGAPADPPKPAPAAGMHRHMGRLFRITAEFSDDDAANAHMEAHPGEGVLAVIEDDPARRRIILADVKDEGVPA